MRLIDADALLAEVINNNTHKVGDYAITFDYGAAAAINNAPTIDAEPVRHGKWMFEFALADSNFYRCSECNRQEVLLAKESINEWCPYCHCGAKMDGGAEG